MFVFEDKQQYHPEASLKNGTDADSLPPLVSGIVTDPKHYIDNLFTDTWKKLKMNSLIRGAGFTKRSGIDVTGRHVMGQQVLTLGLATEEALLPLDSQIFVSQVKARELINSYKDGRSLFDAGAQ